MTDDGNFPGPSLSLRQPAVSAWLVNGEGVQTTTVGVDAVIDDIAHFKPQLVGLVIRRPKYGSARDPIDLSFLQRLKHARIEEVGITGQLAEQTLPHLTLLAGLRRLYLGRTGLTDGALPILAKLKNLETLQAYGNHFSSEALTMLTDLCELRELYMEDNELSVIQLEFLVSRLPELQRLRLWNVSGPLLQWMNQHFPNVDFSLHSASVVQLDSAES